LLLATVQVLAGVCGHTWKSLRVIPLLAGYSGLVRLGTPASSGLVRLGTPASSGHTQPRVPRWFRALRRPKATELQLCSLGGAFGPYEATGATVLIPSGYLRRLL